MYECLSTFTFTAPGRLHLAETYLYTPVPLLPSTLPSRGLLEEFTREEEASREAGTAQDSWNPFEEGQTTTGEF
jgi:hypothetical protein